MGRPWQQGAAAAGLAAAICALALRLRSRARRARLPELTLRFAGEICGDASTPGGELQDERERLSLMDSIVVPPVFSIRVMLRFDVVLDEDRVQKGLAKALDVFPAYAARLGADRDGDLLQLRAGDSGAYFESYVGRTRGVRLPDHRDRESVWAECCLAAKEPYTAECGFALLAARLVVFPGEGVSFLGVAANHCVGDASNLAEFLHTWSKLCHPDCDPAAPELAQRAMGKRIYGPRLPIKNEKELHEYHEEHIGGFNPLDAWAFRRTLPLLLWSTYFYPTVSLPVNGVALRRYKEVVQTRLRQDDPSAWVSSYEVMLAILLCLRAEYDATSWFGWGYDRVWKKHCVHVIANARGRAPEFSRNYVGNATVNVDFSVSVPRDLVLRDLDGCVSSVSKQLHDGLRAQLGRPADLTRALHWLESAKAIGAAGWSSAFFPPLVSAVRGAGSVCNSWHCYPWLEVDMGSPQQATSMAATFDVMRNSTLELPCHRPSAVSLLKTRLPPGTARHVQRRWSTLPIAQVAWQP